MSTITFEPREQGIVRTFEITGSPLSGSKEQNLVKEVTVEAPVILPDGQTVRKTLVVTMQRAMDGLDAWTITGVAVRDAAASPPAPRS